MSFAAAARPRASASIQSLGTTAYRSFTTARRAIVPARARLLHPPIARNTPVQCVFRRSFADQVAGVPLGPVVSANSSPPPPPPRKKKAGVIRWTWRLTKLGVAGSLAYLIWTMYDFKHPADQIEPHPSKKTLVVLGKPASKLT